MQVRIDHSLKPLGTGAALTAGFGDRRGGFCYASHCWQSAGEFLLVGADGHSTRPGVGAFRRTDPLGPAWDRCLSRSRALGRVTGSQREAASEPPCDRDPSLHQPGLTATEPPSNAVSFEVEEGNDLVWGSICTRCSATSMPFRALHLPPLCRSTQAPCLCPGVTRRCPCPFLLPCPASTTAHPAPGARSESTYPWLLGAESMVGQEGCPAAPPPSGNRCHSCGTRGARGHPPKHP